MTVVVELHRLKDIRERGAEEESFGGLPVGAIYVQCQRSIQRCREILETAMGEDKFRFRGIDMVVDAVVIEEAGSNSSETSHGTQRKGAICHLPVTAAATMYEVVGECSGAMATFLAETGSEWLPGVRFHDPIFRRSEVGPSIPVSLPPPPVASRPVAAAPASEDGNRLSSAPSFRFAELFAGIGGFRIALQELGGTCVLASEIDPFAVDTYTENFGTGDGSVAAMIGDICEYSVAQLPDFDILTGGFPCQPFSTRGKQPGLLDQERGGMYRELERLLKGKQPRAFIFENVVGLVLMEGGTRRRTRATNPTSSRKENAREETEECGISGAVGSSTTATGATKTTTHFVAGHTMARMVDCFRGCGYDVSWRVVNARHWLPQYRERVYIVGRRRKTMDTNGGSGVAALPSRVTVSTSVASSDPELAEESGGSVDWFDWRRVGPPQAEADARARSTVRDIMEASDERSTSELGITEGNAWKDCALTASQWNVVLKQCSDDQAAVTLTAASHDQAALETNAAAEAIARRQRVIDPDSKAPTLPSGYRNVGNITTKYIFEERDGTARKRPRFFSPRECARLMGFPDSFRIPADAASASDALSAAERRRRGNVGGGRWYKQIGNAVCPPVVKAIGAELLRVCY